MAHTTIIQNAIPTRYDPRVTVKPCDPARVPYLPVEILYHIAKALPQPKQVYNLALASRETWEYLQPALYECEVTYESRLAHKYGGESLTSLDPYYGKYFRGEDTAPGTDQPPQENELRCQGHDTSEECNNCKGRLSLEKRVFHLKLPEFDKPFQIRGAMTALHWAAKQGALGLPVAQKAIRSALAHQPSYINGVNLKVRYYRGGKFKDGSLRLFPADLPPPLFLSVAYGNTAVVEALINAGCDLDLLQGQHLCTAHVGRKEKEKRLMSYKIHKECEAGRDSEECVCDWKSHGGLSEDKPCQTVSHLAIDLGQTEILKMFLQRGLNAQQGFFPLIHYAVAKGNMAAVKALVDHDPSLIHSRMMEDTAVMHTLAFTRQEYLAKKDKGQLKDMISCLVECGADLEARTDTYTGYDGRIHGGLTALQATLDFVASAELERNILTALHAVEVFISMGASWDQELDVLFFRGGVLEFCVQKAVTLLGPEYHPDGYDDDTISDMFLNRRIRKAFGRIVKIIIEKATESSSQGDNALNRETYSAAFLRAFSRLTNYRRNHLRGPFATEAVGRLLLSTGITPSRKDMLRWKMQILSSYDVKLEESDYEMSNESDDETSAESDDEAWTENKDEASAKSNEEGQDESDDESSINSNEGLSEINDEASPYSEQWLSETDDLCRSKDRRAEDGGRGNWAFLLSGVDDEGWASDIAERELNDTETEIFSESDDEKWFSEDDE